MTTFSGNPPSPFPPSSSRLRAVAVVGFSNSGKTGLICRLLPVLAARGLRVAVLKHSQHADPDRGKDSWRYRQAGAEVVGLAAPGLLQISRTVAGEPHLEEALNLLAAEADLVLVEGYKSGPLPKVAVLGPDAPPDDPDFPHLIALVSDGPRKSSLPVFQADQVEELGQWLYEYVFRD
ncbi:MAG: molybdopterin-guanine dinucleotide biosynthesis protein B [Desulfobaccales bacterium]